MKWNEALYTLSDKKKIDPIEMQALMKLAFIRDEVFFPDYFKYGFLPLDICYNETQMPETLIYTFSMEIRSETANRRLLLSFVFAENKDIFNGVITDSIALEKKGLCLNGFASMDLLIQKRAHIKNIPDYRRLSSYKGTLEERFKACLTKIKHNYDCYIEDIISGASWDDYAIDTSYR